MLKPLSEIRAWKSFLATPWMRLPKWLSKWAKSCLSSKTSSSKSTLSSQFKNLTKIEVKWSHNLWSQKAINLQYLFSSRNCTKTKIFSFKKKNTSHLHRYVTCLIPVRFVSVVLEKIYFWNKPFLFAEFLIPSQHRDSQVVHFDVLISNLKFFLKLAYLSFRLYTPFLFKFPINSLKFIFLSTYLSIKSFTRYKPNCYQYYLLRFEP